jgi:hypothetical protein
VNAQGTYPLLYFEPGGARLAFRGSTDGTRIHHSLLEQFDRSRVHSTDQITLCHRSYGERPPSPSRVCLSLVPETVRAAADATSIPLPSRQPSKARNLIAAAQTPCHTFSKAGCAAHVRRSCN